MGVHGGQKRAGHDLATNNSKTLQNNYARNAAHLRDDPDWCLFNVPLEYISSH